MIKAKKTKAKKDSKSDKKIVAKTELTKKNTKTTKKEDSVEVVTKSPKKIKKDLNKELKNIAKEDEIITEQLDVINEIDDETAEIDDKYQNETIELDSDNTPEEYEALVASFKGLNEDSIENEDFVKNEFDDFIEEEYSDNKTSNNTDKD